jgi:hypothetical protein
MKNHEVKTANYKHQFKEITSIDEMEQSGFRCSDAMQVWHNNGGNITKFVHGLRLEENWLPYGYGLRFVLNRDNGAMTAFLFKHQKQ